MITWIRWYPGDRAMEVLVIVLVAVAFTSGGAWLISRSAIANPALRRLVLLWALIWCLACPVLAFLCAAMDLTIWSISGEEAVNPRVALVDRNSAPMPSRA